MSVVMAANSASPVRRTWADIVKRSEDHKSEVVRKPLEKDGSLDRRSCKTPAAKVKSEVGAPSTKATVIPGQRGMQTCVCHGRISAMLGPFGWIEPCDHIDHPLTSKNEGQIYVHKRDVIATVPLEEGQLVSFYLYVEEWGLGAEACVEHNPAALVSLKPVEQTASSGTLNADAPVFVPSSLGHDEAKATPMNAEVAEIAPPICSNVQLDTHVSACAEYCKVDMCAFIEEYFCDDSDDDICSTCIGDEISNPPTSVDMFSDSEPDSPNILTPFGWVRPPPGLPLPGK